jgi:hypothetical protein
MASLTRAWGRDPRQPVTSLREQMRRAEREREEGEVQLLVRVAVGVQDEVVPVVRVVRREGHDVVGVLLDYGDGFADDCAVVAPTDEQQQRAPWCRQVR